MHARKQTEVVSMIAMKYLKFIVIALLILVPVLLFSMKPELYSERFIGALQISPKHVTKYTTVIEVKQDKFLGVLLELVSGEYDPSLSSSELFAELCVKRKSDGESEHSVLFDDRVSLQSTNWKIPHPSYIIKLTDEQLKIWNNLKPDDYMIEFTFSDAFEAPFNIKVYSYYLKI